jgi:hypothetical protein
MKEQYQESVVNVTIVVIVMSDPIYSFRPSYHVVPSRDVATHTSTGHSLWLQTPGRAGRQHVDSPVRKFSDLDDQYLERWDLLGL